MTKISFSEKDLIRSSEKKNSAVRCFNAFIFYFEQVFLTETTVFEVATTDFL